MRKAILITGGGTGGHVYPALSIVPFLIEPEPDPSLARDSNVPPSDVPVLVYLGNSRGMERQIIPATGIRSFLFPMAPPTGPRGIVLLALATLRSLVVLCRVRPAVTFATGGYVSVPAALASWLLRIPVVVFLPDIVPGKAVSALIPLARRIAVVSDEAAQQVPPGKSVITGYPLRETFLNVSRESARSRLGLPTDAKLLFVYGGSQGSRSINQALASCLPELLRSCHVVHACGEQRLAEAQAAMHNLAPDLRSRYHLYSFLQATEMADALAAADLVLCRSGASTLAELPAAGAPAVLVPLPDPAVHQHENAEYLANHGAAVILKDGDLQTELCSTLQKLLADSPGLERMREAASSCARPEAARALATLVREVSR